MKKKKKLSKGISLCICPRGSMTLEAAIVFPLVAAFLAFILFFFQVMKIEKEVQDSLIYAARKTAASVSLSSAEPVLTAEALGYWSASLQDKDILEQFVKNGMLGFDFAGSDFGSDTLTLKTSYTIGLPIDLFGIGGIPVTQSHSAKKWTGDQGNSEEEDDPYVYITKDGTVYHTTMECSYLALTIEEVEYAMLGNYRDESGHIYYACPLCAEEEAGYQTVYITDFGERFHTDLNCPGLRRTIYMVRLSEVEGRGACSKCGGN